MPISKMQVTITRLVPDRGIAVVKESSTLHELEVPVLPMRVRMPQEGEVWMIDKELGNWSFLALVSGSHLPPGVKYPIVFDLVGALTVVSSGGKTVANDFGRSMLIESLRATLGTPSTGSPLVADLCLDGVSLGHPVTLAPGTASLKVPVSIAWPPESFLSLKVPTVGSGTPGSDLNFTAVTS